jgi:hypothetical protein
MNPRSSPWDRDPYEYDEPPVEDNTGTKCLINVITCLFPPLGILLCILYNCHVCQHNANVKKQNEARRSMMQQRLAVMEQNQAVERAQSLQNIRDWTNTPASHSVTFRSSTTGNALTFAVDAKQRMHLSR